MNFLRNKNLKIKDFFYGLLICFLLFLWIFLDISPNWTAHKEATKFLGLIRGGTLVVKKYYYKDLSQPSTLFFDFIRGLYLLSPSSYVNDSYYGRIAFFNERPSYFLINNPDCKKKEVVLDYASNDKTKIPTRDVFGERQIAENGEYFRMGISREMMPEEYLALCETDWTSYKEEVREFRLKRYKETAID